MTTKPETNIEKAIAYIAKHPGCRSTEIEEKTGITFAAALLAPAVEAGYLVSCKVSQPGKRPSNEYRLSATVADSKASWSEFRISNRNKTAPPPKAETPVCEFVQTGYSAVNPAIAEAPSPISAPAETEAQRALPPAADESAAKDCNLVRTELRILFLIDSIGELRIEMPDGTLVGFSRHETQSLGRLMMATEPIWSAV